MNILLGVTGSVAATLTPKLALALKELGDVRIVITESAKPFLPPMPYKQIQINDTFFPVYTEEEEWTWKDAYTYTDKKQLDLTDNWQLLDDIKFKEVTAYRERKQYKKDDLVAHIELRKWADVLVIAPLTANTLAKMTYGLCDNLLTSIYRAWDWTKEVVVAPAMNTMMWTNNPTFDQIHKLQGRGVKVVPPIKKELACGDTGEGAMAEIRNIVIKTEAALHWEFPLHAFNGIPIGKHPGAFAFRRKNCHHCGVDLYTGEGVSVRAVESGRVVGIEKFTGPQDTTPWYENTEAVLIEGKTGVICYGEIHIRGHNPTGFASAMSKLNIGDWVKKGEVIGRVTPVIPEGREPKEKYPGWSRSMLHLELYKHGHYTASHRWILDTPMWDYLIDPTPHLLSAIPPAGTLEYE